MQLALNVTDIDAAVDFYSKLFATEPAKRKPGYANFAIADPPLKLVLFEGTDGGTINHLGVETETGDRGRSPPRPASPRRTGHHRGRRHRLLLRHARSRRG